MFASSTLVATLLGVSLAVASGGVISTQFHAQDGHGGYSYGHSGGPSSKTETGTAGGLVSGTYSYVDGHGVVQTASYTADPVHGFTVHASNLPTPPPSVPVAAHEATYASSWSPVAVDRPLGVPVVDTPEVAHAKMAHLAAVEHQKLIIASHPYRTRRSADDYHPHKGFNYHVTTVHEHPKYVHEQPKYVHYPAEPHYYYPFYYYPEYPHHYPEYPLASKPGAPEDVTDTPDVQLAKIEHLAAVEHQKALVGAHH